MNLQTIVPLPAYSFGINHSTPFLLMGSCFSENIGKKLEDYRFNIVNNPFGILYNPISIAQNLEYIFENKKFHPEELFLFQNIYRSWSHHGSYAHSNADEAILLINNAIEKAHKLLQCPAVIGITLGSAYCYKLKNEDRIVANCHGYPNTEFEKILLSQTAIVEALSTVIDQHPMHNYLFTISPVRHWRDGAIENQRSKAHLISAVHELVDKYNNCHYFPAYELLMDELRDYRFYKEDMLHPNDVAVQYIYNKFESRFFDDKTIERNKLCHKLLLLKQHRPIHRDTTSYKQWQDKIAELEKLIDF